jgi:hypothetical protein
VKEQFNDGGPAFPNRGDNTPTNPIYDGMSLRDWFAGKAVNGMLSQPPATFMSKHKSLWEPALEKSEHWTQFAAKVAELGYDIADAMLAAREKGETK